MSARERARLRWMFPQLRDALVLNAKPAGPPRALTAEERMWTVRGQPRTRAAFGLPHPDDFHGGLPIPAEYPASTAAPAT